MARPRTIDRDRVLDCVEHLVQREGVAALTLDAVAREAGITKGGLQYCFGSKDDLITALIDRWIAVFDAQVSQNMPGNPDATDRARAYLLVASQIDEATQARMAGMLVTLMQSPKHLHRLRAWYARWFKVCNPASAVARRARTALFAAEGAFFLRSTGFIEMDQAEWETVFADFEQLVTSPQASTD
ncbi:TetR/AcrR family transcriptional regulator [Komagataeibacter xylinus]|uniref:TetR/AcrR family transcriptional regulator n=1 Tax=Komagataeibacter xylinus TaxID=28448 RepID=A0A318Q1V6_KOMXY|nr:TetR/AcrR family transcriptional regulator [Komagataeibacter xylinus]AZV38250.1 TetR/AcrR family transcriptional regulator [Komagataeibacter xylinus]PYD56779.1 TetR/AcrR family transcriptional regulator [Komagataeibacter xylinus]GBQ66985.1 TetR family transcriptional regulator [Komagataeibacter xylinus NBRC 15237]